ncbi:AraC family transcriptional regulator [Maricaulis sp.]|uniref:helix-turn-helix domain-containing protein n=1 Tax=Maricaulis sp. TaxID=1486257 RepID=UPI0026048CC1|nr:AraC family transcriptional regulator [Maricaulis sp.]
MLEIAGAIKLAVAGLALTWIIAIAAMPKRSLLHLTWAVFCTGLTAVMLREVFGGALGPAAPLVIIAGCGTCSVFWLVARALFRTHTVIGPAELMLVAGIFAPTVIDQAVLSPLMPSAVEAAYFPAVAGGLDGFQTLLSSTVLVLAFWEGLRGWSSRLTVNERRLRLLYLSTFGLGVSTCVMLLDHGNAPLPAELMAGIQAACALAILVVMSGAIRYRAAHPLVPETQTRAAGPASEDDRALGHRVRDILAREHLYLDPDLKVAGLARRLHEPDYRISRAITAGLGEPNFNRLINRYRIDHAMEQLHAPASADLSILEIALDSGFASIGPFNRAFKDVTGQTPRAFRAAGRDAPPGLAAE